MVTKYVITEGNKRTEFLSINEANTYKSGKPGATGPVTIQEPDPVPFVFVPPSQPCWRVKAICSIMGLVPTIDAVIESLDEPDRTIARLGWREGSTVERSSPLVALIQAAANLTDAEADEIFIKADALNV